MIADVIPPKSQHLSENVVSSILKDRDRTSSRDPVRSRLAAYWLLRQSIPFHLVPGVGGDSSLRHSYPPV
jgi:hypothetical protein